MKRFFVLGIIMLAVASCSKKESEPARATVSPSAGVFWFPVSNVNAVWKWGVSSESLLEYSWMVRVTLSNKKYEFGYTKWKFPEEQKTEGTLMMLLNNGQKNIWLENKFIKRMFTVGAYPDGNGVTIYLTDVNLLGELMTQQPSSVTFFTDGTMMNKTEKKVRVKYLMDSKKN